MKRRVLSILTALALCLTLLPTAALATGPATHDVTTAGDLAAAIANDNYDIVKLTDDIEIFSTLQVNRTVTLDLNGYVLKYENTTKGSVIMVDDSDAHLTLKDSNTSTTHTFYVDTDGKWNLCTTESCADHADHETVTGGVITGGTGTTAYSSTYGGGVFVSTGSTFTMTGGNIVGCTAANDGGGVYVYGGGNTITTTFTMTGGSIQGCATNGNGGGVCLQESGATFTMSGGTIADCTAKVGGGVKVSSGGSFTMSGGTITGCTSTNNNGMEGGGGVFSSGSFTMSGGTIENCTANGTASGGTTANGNGGGVFHVGGTCALQGGTITGNTASNNGGGVYVYYGQTLTVGGGSTALNITGNKKGTASSTADDNIYLYTDAYSGNPATITFKTLAPGSDISLSSLTPSDLDLTQRAFNNTITNDAYTWDFGTKTLTLKNTQFGNITLPNVDTTIKIEGDVTVNNIGNNTFTNTLTIEGSGTNPNLTVTERIACTTNTNPLTFKNLTATVGCINWNHSHATADGLKLENSTLTVKGVDESGTIVGIIAGQITLDDTSTITLESGYISGNGDGVLSTVPGYCPTSGYTIGPAPGDTDSVNRYLLAPSNNIVTNITLQKPTEPTPTPAVDSGGDSDPAYSIVIAPTEHGSIPLRRKYAEKGETVTLPVTPDTGYTLETLTVTDKNGKELKLKVKGDGAYTFTMPASKVIVTATFTNDSTEPPFVDVTADKYYYDAVLWAAENGITGGVDATHFGADRACTRAQLAAFLYRCAQARGEGFTGAWMFRLPFTDVPEWCYEAVAWCYMNGVVQGYSDETFAPSRTVTRQQAVAMLYRFAQAMGLNVSVGEDTNILSYNDVLEVSEYAVEAFQWAVGAGIVQGNNGNLNPNAPCTRAQIVTMLYRLLGK